VKRLFYILIIVLFSLPVFGFCTWLFKAKSSANIVVIDKTSHAPNYSEHKTLFWCLNHNKVISNRHKTYDYSEDYFGLHKNNRNEFETKDLSQFSIRDINSIVDSVDIAFLLDTYGKYRYDSIENRNVLVYGGTNRYDLYFLEQMEKRDKFVFAEYNVFASPTNYKISSKLEDFFGVKWTGWVGRYYYSLDKSVNVDLPDYVPSLYEKQYNKAYDFKNGGIILLNKDGRIIVLENKNDLNTGIPKIISNYNGMLFFELPENIDYPFWFSINEKLTNTSCLAKMEFDTTKTGNKLLQKNGLKNSFPIIFTNSMNYEKLYLSLDFSDCNIGYYTSYIANIEYFKEAFYNKNNPHDRNRFFWNFYQPFMKNYLNHVLKAKKGNTIFPD
jgi:hypothetical protein